MADIEKVCLRYFSDEPTDESAEAVLGGQFDFFRPQNDDDKITDRVVSDFNLGGPSASASTCRAPGDTNS